ncbi:uncharacterized protein [Paramisgurnus dabryanus]|uniref:uncharacterized protein n=1 Tax=Paramisgurnus dabryanus TaxID=90735 RepID=UPI003CCF5DC9
MFDFNGPELSKVIYYHVSKTDDQGTDSETMEMMTDNCERGDDFRTQTDSNPNRQQPLQSTGSENLRKRSYRSVTVCLVLLCVLLLTAVIVLCVLINTNNQQFNIKTKKLTEERDELKVQCGQKNDLAFRLFLLTGGWIYYQSSLYFISTEKKSWSESRSYCRERGADLIIINNKDEQDFIKKAGMQNIWIGLSDSEVEGRWKWVDNSTLTSGFWAPGEPNNYKGRRENCAESYPSVWNDNSCHTTLKWISLVLKGALHLSSEPSERANLKFNASCNKTATRKKESSEGRDGEEGGCQKKLS